MKMDDTQLGEELTYTHFDRMSERCPDRPAVIYLGERFSYVRLRDLSERFAGALSDMGVGKGDRVMIYIPNCVQWFITFLAVQKIGAVIVPVSPIYTSFEIEYMINDSGAETIICQDTNFCYVKDVIDKTVLKRAIVTNLVDLLPFWKRGLGVLFDKLPRGKVSGYERVVPFVKLLSHAPIDSPTHVDPWKDLSYILYTGGT
ncbi:MAG: AMP-binding protein, partial [Deltaproteobacteria bacterium]